MTRRWLIVALIVGWMGVPAVRSQDQPPPAAAGPLPTLPAPEQGPMTPPGPAAPGTAPPVASPPGFAPPPGEAMPLGAQPPCPPPPPLAPPGCLPPDMVGNSFECPPPPCPCGPCGWVGVDYLHYWVRGQQIPLLLTTGSLNDAIPGALGQPNTRTALDQIPGSMANNGVRLRGGYYLDSATTWAIEGSAFALEQGNAGVTFRGDGSPGSQVLSRPFFDAQFGIENADPVNLPGFQSGQFTVALPRRFYGAQANVLYSFGGSSLTGSRLALVLGGRFLSLDEKLLTNETVQDIPGQGIPGNIYRLSENFTTYNRFYGGQTGLDYQYRLGPIVLQAVGKVAFGTTREMLRISGQTTVSEPDGRITTGRNSALLVQPSNAGSYSQNGFAVVPEGDFNVAIDLNQYIRFTVGYTGLYWTRVAHPGDQVSRTATVQPVGAPNPTPPVAPVFNGFQTANFWAQGFTIGLQLTY